MKTNLREIASEQGHNNSVFKKVLIGLNPQNGQVATYNYSWLKKGMTLNPHTHPDGEEYYLFLEGEGEMLVGDEWIAVKKDDFITVPQNAMHSIKNNNEEKLLFITLRVIRQES